VTEESLGRKEEKPMRIGKVGWALGKAAAVGAVAVGAYAFALRPWHLKWGATSEEVNRDLPGDDLVPNPDHQATHAITINASPARVWPWLAQIGQNRGGFYSYSWLENLAGCEIHNADHVVPEWQTIRTGDVLWLHPRETPLPVLFAEPDRALVVGGATPVEFEGATEVEGGTWCFFLEPVDEHKTRLIVRIRWSRKPGFRSRFYDYFLLEPAHFVMERKMLLGIKGRVEALAESSAPQAIRAA